MRMHRHGANPASRHRCVWGFPKAAARQCAHDRRCHAWLDGRSRLRGRRLIATKETRNMAEASGKGHGRVALVTGGMGGLGETIAAKMADAGYKVVVTYSPSNTKHSEWVQAMKGKGYDILAVPCDVADYDSCVRAVGEVQGKVGAVDILVNNAGITRDMTFKKMDKAAWEAVTGTNLDSLFNMCKQVVDGMVERNWGRIINVSSVNGSKGAFGQTNYSAAKAGVHGKPEEVAGLIIYLASDEAAFVTGANIAINGGQHMQ